MRDFIRLIENNFSETLLWYGTDKETAKTLMNKIPEGFHIVNSPELAIKQFESDFSSLIDDDRIVLEYKLKDHIRILDLTKTKEKELWDKQEKDFKSLIKNGIDGIHTLNGITFFNTNAIEFTRVYSGVIDDPLDDIDINKLDEFALGGLKRCTAVTVNSILKAYKIPTITLNDVPIDNPGVLKILDSKGLSYTPYNMEIGRTLKQFSHMHRMDIWYLLTLGHALALINGELFDAENKGPDGRKLEAVFKISKR